MIFFSFFFSSRRRHTRLQGDWSSDVCSSDLLYVDGAHPEYSTPECTTARDVVLYEKAGEHILAAAVRAVELVRGPGSLLVYKNNTDGKGNSYGYHENYLVARTIPFERIARALVPFLVTRQIYAGAGKVGAENQTAA